MTFGIGFSIPEPVMHGMSSRPRRLRKIAGRLAAAISWRDSGSGGSKLRVEPTGKNVNRPAVGIVRRGGNELIIESDARPAVQTLRVISFQDLLRPVIKRPVPHQKAKAPDSEITARL